MGIRWFAASLLAAALAWSGVAIAQQGPDVDASHARVSAGRDAAYRAVLADFDKARQAAPDDPALVAARCDFISYYSYDDADWIEQAESDLAKCTAMLYERWPNAPATQLHALDDEKGDEALERGERLLTLAHGWPAPLRRRLYARMAELFDDNDQPDRAGEMAVQAARLGDADQVADAVAYLAKSGKDAEATRMLRSAAPADESWTADGRVKAALALSDKQAALRELQRYAGTDAAVDDLVAARAHARAGDLATARKVLAEVAPPRTAKAKQAHFDVAMSVRDYPAAVATLTMGDAEDLLPSLGRFVSILRAAPWMLLSVPMLGWLFALLALMGALALLPGLLLVPVHYRGLARRLRHLATRPPFPAIGLRHAWIGLAIAMVVPLGLSLLLSPAQLGGGLPPAPELFRLMLVSTCVGLVLLSPLAVRFGRRGWFGDRATWRFAWWRVLLSWFALMVIAATLNVWHQASGGSETTQIKMMQELATGAAGGSGALLTIALVAMLVPVLEELTFRGLLLGGLSRHIGFGWANAIQACAFAAMHGDPPRFLFYFAMGLLGGWLVRRTQSLGPAIVLHGLNNALAMGALMATLR